MYGVYALLCLIHISSGFNGTISISKSCKIWPWDNNLGKLVLHVLLFISPCFSKIIVSGTMSSLITRDACYPGQLISKYLKFSNSPLPAYLQYLFSHCLHNFIIVQSSILSFTCDN